MFRRLLVPPVFLIASFLSRPCYSTAAGGGDPEVTIIYPPPNVFVSYCSTIRLLAAATSTDTTIEKVDFFVSTNLVGTATAAPYQVNWRPCTDVPKNYTLRAIATDTLGRSNETAVPVYVTQAPGPARFSITSPTNGLVVTAPAAVKLSAVLTLTDGGDNPLGFYLGTNLVGRVTQPPYELAVSNLSIGDYTFRLGVTNEFGIVDVSPRVNFRVGTFTDNPPSVRIANLPVNNGFISPATIHVRAEADDPDGRIASVQFLDWTNVIGTVATPPFVFVWTNVLSAPAHRFISAKATDELGVSTQSDSITIGVVSASEIPVFLITQPVSHTHFVPGSPVTIQAEIFSDNNLNPVEFFSGTNFLGSAPEWPYLLTVTNLSKGSHCLLARQTTLSGKTGRSDPIAIIVGELGFVESSLSQGGFQTDVIGEIKGKTVVIQSSTNLMDWTPISPTMIEVQIGTNDVIQIIDAKATNHPLRFYRAHISQ